MHLLEVLPSNDQLLVQIDYLILSKYLGYLYLHCTRAYCEDVAHSKEHALGCGILLSPLEKQLGGNRETQVMQQGQVVRNGQTASTK